MLAELPVHVVVIVPRDFDYYAANWSQALAVTERWTREVQAWYQREIGQTIRFVSQLHFTQYTLFDLQTEGTNVARDACGDGFDETAVTRDVLNLELGLFTAQHRIWTVVIGGGGWAGGRSIYEIWGGVQQNHGRMFLGDWGIRYALGIPQPACNPWADVANDRCDTYGHEGLHSMFVDSHNPYVGCNDPLSAQQRADLGSAYNTRWLSGAQSLTTTEILSPKRVGQGVRNLGEGH